MVSLGLSLMLSQTKTGTVIATMTKNQFFLMRPPTPPEESAPPAIASTVDANQPIAAAVSLTEVEV